jgi:N-formylmaleamate deformylase
VTSIEPRGTRREVMADGLRLSVLHYPGDGPDLVIVPGITTTATGCDFLAAELAARFNVVAVDMRGRGQSDRASAGRYGLDDYASDVTATIDQLGLSLPAIIGHSLGARIVARWGAGQATHGPLVLVDPPLSGKARAYPTPWASFETQLSEAAAGTTIDAVQRYYPAWSTRELQVRIQELPTCDVDAVKETHAGFETDEFEADWCRLSAPVTLIYGADSPMVSREDASQLADQLPHATVKAVSGAGHMVPWDNLPGFLAAIAGSFTSDTEPGGHHG